MKAFFDAVQRWLEGASTSIRLSGKAAVRRPSFPASSPSRRSARTVVNRFPRPYWEERDWKRKGRNYRGSFQTSFGSWIGQISVSPSGRVDVFIKNPPEVLQRHPHWHC